jgi:tRNA (Thr-GGU) A37 N-methylase
LSISFRENSHQANLFAIQPGRPNPIGLSIVRLESLEGNILSVLDVDVVNKTPILDIKLYVANAINVLAHESVKLNRSEKKYQKILHT